MNTINFIRLLFDKIQEFEEEGRERSIASFIRFLSEEDSKDKREPEEDLTLPATRLLDTVFSFTKHYTRKSFRDASIYGADDYYYLYHLVHEGDMKKSELISRSFSEYSPGMEVIKRLLRQGMIEDFPDTTDKRAMRVRITDRGREAFTEGEAAMEDVAEITMGILNTSDMKDLIRILSKLKSFHEELYLNIDKFSTEELKTRVHHH